MEDLERERDFYRQQCNELGAKVLRLQKGQTRTQREARRIRTAATLIREVYRLASADASMEEIDQRFLQVILDTLNVDRAALLEYSPEQGCFVAQHTLGFPPAGQPGFTPPDLPGEYCFANSNSAPDPLLDCLRQAAGVPYLLWAFNPRAGVSLLVGNATEDRHLHRPFEEGDREIVESALNVFIDITERQQAQAERERLLAELEAVHRAYLQREWRDYLRQRDPLRQSGFIYDQTRGSAVPVDSTSAEGQTVQISNLKSQISNPLTAPITLRGQTIGVLGVEDPDGTRDWSDEERALIEAVSRQLALTLENARLLEEAQRRAARERLVGEIAGRVRASMDADTILKTTVRELGHALGAQLAAVEITSPERNDDGLPEEKPAREREREG